RGRRRRAWGLHGRAGWWRRPARWPRRAVWLWCRRRLRRLNWRDDRPLRGTRRSGAKTPTLIVAKSLRLRHARDGLHDGLCRLQCRLQWAWASRARLAALVPLPCAVEILWPHLHRTGDTLRAREDARLDVEGRHGPTRRGSDNAGSDAWIDGKATAPVAMLEPDGAIDDHRPSENDNRALRRQEVAPYARRHQIARRQKDPVGRIIVVFVDDLVRRQWRPADIVVTAAPIDPGRTPLVTGHPEPTKPAIMRPAAIVKRHPTPVGLF